MSKLELLFLLFQDGYRPLDFAERALTLAGGKFVSMGGLLNSKSYLLCLLDAERVWDRGTTQIAHDDARHCYECLLKFNKPEQRLGPNPSIIADADLKKLLQRLLGQGVLLASVGIEDGVEPGLDLVVGIQVGVGVVDRRSLDLR